MSSEEHYRKLERMYPAAPINDFYRPTIAISEGRARIEIELSEKMHHAAGAVHGSVYFKMLDDAAYFAASSLVEKVFILTTSFTTYLIRPISKGKMIAIGKVVNRTRTQLIAEAVVYDGSENEIARGSGVFVRGKQLLENVPGYGE